MNHRRAPLIASVCLLGLAAAWTGLFPHALAQPGSDRGGSEQIRGMVLPIQQVLIHAPVDGIVAKLPVKEGDLVEEGDLLLQMDDEVQKAVVAASKLRAEATANLERARLEHEEATIALERMEEAQQQRAAREWEVRRARLRRDISRVAMEAARENQAIAEAEVVLETRRLSRFAVHAPWDGVITSVAVERGATLTRDDAVVRLLSLRRLKAEIYLPASLHGKVKVGGDYELEAGEPVNRTIASTLTFAAPVIDPGSQTFRCVFTIDNPDRKLPAGFAVTLPDPSE